MANILNIVQYIVLHPLFSTKAFLIYCSKVAGILEIALCYLIVMKKLLGTPKKVPSFKLALLHKLFG